MAFTRQEHGFPSCVCLVKPAGMVHSLLPSFCCQAAGMIVPKHVPFLLTFFGSFAESMIWFIFPLGNSKLREGQWCIILPTFGNIGHWKEKGPYIIKWLTWPFKHGEFPPLSNCDSIHWPFVNDFLCAHTHTREHLHKTLFSLHDLLFASSFWGWLCLQTSQFSVVPCISIRFSHVFYQWSKPPPFLFRLKRWHLQNQSLTHIRSFYNMLFWFLPTPVRDYIDPNHAYYRYVIVRSCQTNIFGNNLSKPKSSCEVKIHWRHLWHLGLRWRRCVDNSMVIDRKNERNMGGN